MNGRYLSATLEYVKDPLYKYHKILYKDLIESLSPREEEKGTVQVLIY